MPPVVESESCPSTSVLPFHNDRSATEAPGSPEQRLHSPASFGAGSGHVTEVWPMGCEQNKGKQTWWQAIWTLGWGQHADDEAGA